MMMDDDTGSNGDIGAGKARLLLIDGSGYIFRAFHATAKNDFSTGERRIVSSMHRSDGTPVNAVYGFTQMVMKLIKLLMSKKNILYLNLLTIKRQYHLLQ